MNGKVILIPIALAEDGYDALPASIATAINACQVFFAENKGLPEGPLKKLTNLLILMPGYGMKQDRQKKKK